MCENFIICRKCYFWNGSDTNHCSRCESELKHTTEIENERDTTDSSNQDQ